jgi:tetratricopeptide (TPR) repeat protein
MAKNKPEAVENDGKSRFVRMERETLNRAAELLFKIGNEFFQGKNAPAARECYINSVDLNPFCEPSVFNLGILYNACGNVEAARRMATQSIRMNPGRTDSLIMLADIARKSGDFKEAKELVERASKLDPENYFVLSARAMLAHDEANWEEALRLNEEVLKLKPGDLGGLLNRALLNMLFGRWSEFWNLYEIALSYGRNEKMKGLRIQDSWHGQEFSGKTLIVVSDQGNGDTLQFSRYLKDAKALGKFGKLIYLVQPDLKDLMSRVEGVDEVVGFGERLKVDYDAFSSLLGIMRVLQVSPDNCHRPPHVTTTQASDDLWRSRLQTLHDGKSKKVGVVWCGDYQHGNDAARSLSMDDVVPLTKVSGVQVFSFQVLPEAKQRVLNTQNMLDLGSDFRSFSDTASALKQMDLLISCDTSVVHLAGCMGVRTWVLVPTTTEWRWLLHGDEAKWYSNVKIVRQQKRRNWGSVIERVSQELEEWAKT